MTPLWVSLTERAIFLQRREAIEVDIEDSAGPIGIGGGGNVPADLHIPSQS